MVLFARAITGESIELFEAEREGGYKNNNFFLPSVFSSFPTNKENISFYLFRILYLSVQKNMDLNRSDSIDHSLSESRLKAAENSEVVLKELFEQFPVAQDYYQKIILLYQNKEKAAVKSDYSMVFGKWIQNSKDDSSQDTLENFNTKTKTADENEPKTVLKAKAVEEIISVQLDQQQLDDAVLQHQFEKVETADEFGGNFRDMDGDDDLQDHENALEELNMKYTVRVDDPVHSVYQADFVEIIP